MTYQKKYELFLPHWFSTYLWQTRGMNFEERGVFIELRDAYWVNGCKPMSLVDLHQRLGCTKRLLAKVIEKANGVNTEDGVHIIIPSLDEVQKKALQFSKKQSDRRKGKTQLRSISSNDQ